jgi:LytS/YehU family sensor histidine kinase
MLLQPLVENVIRYGLEPKREGGELHLVSWRAIAQEWASLQLHEYCAPRVAARTPASR